MNLQRGEIMSEQLSLLKILNNVIGSDDDITSSAFFDFTEDFTEDFTVASAEDFTEEIVKSVLLRGTGFAGGKGRVVGAYKSGTLNVDFLKNEYGLGGWTQDYPDGSSGMADHNSKGITLVRWKDSEGLTIEPRQERFIPWNAILPVLESMIKSGEYIA